VKYRIIKLENFSGDKASVYSKYLEDEERTLFERFVRTYREDFEKEVKNIAARLNSIANEVGAREQFFKLNEGKPGDLVCALYDDKRKLRLYCIRFGSSLIILGGGGPKYVRAWQEDPTLMVEAEWVKRVSKEVGERIQNREIRFIEDGFELEGNLNFNQGKED
jgi:hypothetical protein